MRMLSPVLVVTALSVAAIARAATQSTPPITEILPVNDAGTITLVVSGASGPFTLKDIRDKSIESSACPVAASRAPAIAFQNKTGKPLRVTLQQPSNACKTACKIDPSAYAEICPDPAHTGLCTPNPVALAVCGTPECNAIRSGCNGAGCQVDIYRVIESCGCSVTKTLSANAGLADLSRLSEVFKSVLKSSRIEISATNSALVTVPESMALVAKSDPVALAAAVAQVANVDPASVSIAYGPERKPDLREHEAEVPTVLFEPVLFSSDKGLISDASYRFVIEQDLDPTKQSAADRIYTPRLLEWSSKGTSACVPLDERGPNMRVVVVPLDDTGVASWRYLNPRNPACIYCDQKARPLGPDALPPAGVVFRNRTFDRTFAVSITLPAGAKLPDAYLRTFNCTPGKQCTISRAVPPQTPVLFDNGILSQLPGALIQFDVALLGEAAQLNNSHAYLSLLPALDDKGKSVLAEPASTTQIKTAISLTGSIDPSLPTVPDKVVAGDSFKPCGSQPGADYKSSLEPVLCTEHPYSGGVTQQYKANGTIQFSPNLGNRADGAASFAFRSGTFGGAIDKIAIDQYFINVYGINGVSLKLGKTKFAVPSGGMAVAESGEGFLYNYHNYSLGHLISRESSTGVADQANRDKKDWFIQARSVSLGEEWREQQAELENRGGPKSKQESAELSVNSIKSFLYLFRTLDWIVLRGEDKNVESRYWTGGGEIFFARPGTSSGPGDEGKTAILNVFGGSIAAYHSHRSYRQSSPCIQANQPTCANGQGTVGLLNMTWTPEIDINTANLKTTTTPQVFTLTYGQGTGDRSGTGVAKGYIGENATFAFDRLFFGKFLPKMNATDRQYVAQGLANKQFIGLKYTNNSVTLFDLIASALNVGDDVNSRSTIISLSDTRLRYPRNNSREADREADVSFQIEVPKGVTFSLDAGYMEPGGAFSDVIQKRAWTLAASVSLSL